MKRCMDLWYERSRELHGWTDEGDGEFGLSGKEEGAGVYAMIFSTTGLGYYCSATVELVWYMRNTDHWL